MTERFVGEPIILTLLDDRTITVQVQRFRVRDDGRVMATLALDAPDDVLIDERPRGPLRRPPRSRV